MARTIISLDAAEKAWLDDRARAEGVAMTEVVRRAIRRYRRGQPSPAPSRVRKALADTRGTWIGGEGLAYQRRLRSEWRRG